jgi:3-oxoacyl-[acyl-carrier protein] reductase
MQDPVLILGATGAIGSAIAKRLAAKGPVVVHGRDENKLALLKNELSNSNKHRVESYAVDLKQIDEVQSLFDNLAIECKNLSGIVFSVAQPFTNKLTHNIPWKDFSEQIDSQLKSLHLVVRNALPLLKGCKGGARLVILSTEFLIGAPPIKTAPYVAAKAALTAYSRVLSQEWLKHNIRVHILAPGMVKSSLIADMPDRYLDQVVEGMPEKQLTTADDVADMAEFLMTPKADTLYGNIIHASRAVRR